MITVSLHICECEHTTHFESAPISMHLPHRYQANTEENGDVVTVGTTYGDFQLCETCRVTCHADSLRVTTAQTFNGLVAE